MNKGQKIVIERGIFTFIITVLFGLIIVNEKKDAILLPRIQKQFDSYIKENYKDIKTEIKTSEIIKESPVYKMKIISKENENYFFYIEYKDKKITDTYQDAYIEGKTFLKSLENKIQDEIKSTTKENCNIEIIATLDKYTSQVKERILKEENLKELKFYSINIELEINNWNSIEITKMITEKLNIYEKNNITPKYYKVTINNKNDITQSIEISNLTSEFITNKYKEQIIKDILSDNETELLKQSKITYQYLN